MKNIAFFCIPAHGHTNPMIAVAAELVRRGNRVRFYSFDEFADKIAASGAEFVSCSSLMPELSKEEEQGLKKVSITEMSMQDIRLTECFTGGTAHLPMVLFAILSILLIWVAINVTNCSDGVDGLSGTLTIITLLTYYVADQILQKTEFNDAIIIFIACLLAYLWFNAGPSLMLMGDAGSRAMGFFIALTALKSGSPFLYLLASIVLIVDGGAGIAKVFLMRHTKIRILQQTTTPIHDHVRKNFGWSNTQTVTRFAIIQMVVSVVTLGIMMH